MFRIVLAKFSAQPGECRADIGTMRTASFDHEKLAVYCLALEFVAWVGDAVDVRGRARPNTLKHLDEASTSIALDIAEGNGKRSVVDRARCLDIARGSALESAACLDVLVARKHLQLSDGAPGKDKLVRIVSMLTKLIERLLSG